MQPSFSELGLMLLTLLLGVTACAAMFGTSKKRGFPNSRKSSRTKEPDRAPFNALEAAASKLADSDPQIRLAALQILVTERDAILQSKVAHNLPILAESSLLRSQLHKLLLIPFDFSRCPPSLPRALHQALVSTQERICELLHDEAWYVREAALEALGRITLPFDEALSYFVTALDDPSEKVRATALKQVSSLEKEVFMEPSCCKAVHTRLFDTSWTVRRLAVSALSKLQPGWLAANGGVLDKLLHDDVVYVQVAAVEALIALQPVTKDTFLMQHQQALDELARAEAIEVKCASEAALRLSPWNSAFQC